MSYRAAALALFQRQYFQLLEPERLAWPEQHELRLPEIQVWIYEHIFDNELIQYPPPERYQLRVLKQLMARIEECIIDPDKDEISDDLMSRLSILLSSKLPSEASLAQQKSYVTYSYTSVDSQEGLHNNSVTVLEARSVLSFSGTTGLRTWEAALHLGSFLTTPAGADLVKGKNVLELGAGTGFLSVLCAKHLGAARVTASDGDAGVVESMGINVFLNGLEGAGLVRSEVLRWGRSLLGTMIEEEMNECPYDIVFGADLTYDKRAIPSLVASICDLIDRIPYLDVVIAATVRNKDNVDMLTNGCECRGLVLKDLEFSPTQENRARGFFYSVDVPIRIMCIQRESQD